MMRPLLSISSIRAFMVALSMDRTSSSLWAPGHFAAKSLFTILSIDACWKPQADPLDWPDSSTHSPSAGSQATQSKSSSAKSQWGCQNIMRMGCPEATALFSSAIIAPSEPPATGSNGMPIRATTSFERVSQSAG